MDYETSTDLVEREQSRVRWALKWAVPAFGRVARDGSWFHRLWRRQSAGPCSSDAHFVRRRRQLPL